MTKNRSGLSLGKLSRVSTGNPCSAFPSTVGLVVSDPYSEPYFRNSSGFNTYKMGPLRGRNTTLAITLTPVTFYLTGLAKHSRHAQSAALLAAEGIADTQILSLVMKQIDGRLPRSDIPPHGNFRDT